MGVKIQALQCNTLSEIVSVSEDKLREVRDILQSRRMREEATRLKDSFLGFYSSLSVGESVRLRFSLLNFFRTVRYPVAALIGEGYQDADGSPRVSLHGPNSTNLGATIVYNSEGVVSDEYVLPIAGKAGHDHVQYDGPWNIFSGKKVIEFENQLSKYPSNHCHSSEKEYRAPDIKGNLDSLAHQNVLVEQEMVGGQFFSTKKSNFNDKQGRTANISYAERLRTNKTIRSPRPDGTGGSSFY